MNQKRWNKLLRKAIAAVCREIDSQKQAAIQRKWLVWANRITGKTCYWMYWR